MNWNRPIPARAWWRSRHAENGVTAFSNMAINALMGGVPSFERELVDGMNATLSRIKAAAES